jgi:hypothetical protein
MQKISLAILASFFYLARVFGQSDTTSYAERKLKLEEVNFVSSYYMQEGNNSAVTGGVGTEHLTDFANTLEVRLHKNDKRSREHSFFIELGVDHYSSASSDKIDPNTVSSASSADTRIYPSLGWSVKNVRKHFTAGLVASYSTEYDYTSMGFGANFSKSSADNNREVGLRLQAYFDRWNVILPLELRPPDAAEDGSIGYEPRNSYSVSLSGSQVINQRLQLALLADAIYQQGLLATRYQRVYFNNLSERVENLPDTRLKLPVGVRLHYFLGDRFILRGYYRYYHDDWGLNAHTISLEVPVKLNPFLSLSPFYRFYKQSAADYFAPYGLHGISEQFYTSDYDLSAYNSQFFGSSIRWAPEKGVLGLRFWTTAELRYGHFIRSNGLTSDIVTLAAKFK